MATQAQRAAYWAGVFASTVTAKPAGPWVLHVSQTDYTEIEHIKDLISPLIVTTLKAKIVLVVDKPIVMKGLSLTAVYPLEGAPS